MDALRRWLEDLGLQQYAGVLADNDIDLDVLPSVTEGDFERLGLSLGHRRKLLQALADSQSAPGNPRPASQEAGRRQVTVMFCDLVGSTELASAIDPEDMGELLRRYQDICAGAVARFEGMVARFMGDGMLAYFGYPQAHEDAAERATRAALAIVEGVKRLKRPDARAFEVRVGIATGIVVIGDIIGTGIAREHSIVGETPNLAARLQALAQPDTILISQSTRQLLGRVFEFEDRGECVLKGFVKPVPVWRVLRDAAVESRFEGARDAGRGPFIGRAQEMETLLEAWRLAKQGEGRVILLVGEAGIGKSRIVDAFCEGIGGDSFYRVLCQCSPHYTQSALHPVIRYLERAAGFAPEDSAVQKFAKLEVLLGAVGAPSPATTSLIADLLSLPAEAGYTPSELLPAQRKEATIRALVEQLARRRERQPVLFVLEDAHWIDPSTRELVARLIDGIAASGVLAVVTARPEPALPWIPGEVCLSLAVAGLGRAQCAEMVAGIVSRHALVDGLVEDIVAKSDGVPLFVEELTKAVLESAASDPSSVPATLHDSLMARLDRLGPVKEIAQAASVIGHHFSYALLQAVVPAAPAVLAAGILRLVESGLVFGQGPEAGASCSFKHALLRDVAYESMLRGRREQLHARIGRALEQWSAPAPETEPELLAYHFGQAGMAELASTYYERAGDRTAARTANAEAVAHFRSGLKEASQLAEGPARSKRELGLLLKLGPALSLTAGPRSPEVEETYRRAHAVAESLADEAAVFKSIWGLWFTAHVTSRFDVAHARVQELMALGQQSTDPDLLLEANHCRWATAYGRGDFATSLAASAEGIRRYDPARHAWMGAVFGGHDPGVCAQVNHASSLATSGLHAQARKCVDQALSLAAMLEHPPSLSQALQSSMVVYQRAGDYEAVLRYTQRMLELADKYSLTPQRAHALFHQGWARACGADLAEGLEIMEGEFPRASAGPYFQYYTGLLAEIRVKAGRVADALAVVEAALAKVTEPGVGAHLPELHRLRGECLLRLDSGNVEMAVHSLQTAIEIAKQQHALLFQFRAAVSLANMCVSMGQADRGIAPLRELRRALPEGFEAAELAEADGLLSRQVRFAG
jgi:class 3 adenylate cyclase/tetratricopeptide (TPR) repeat protein